MGICQAGDWAGDWNLGNDDAPTLTSGTTGRRVGVMDTITRHGVDGTVSRQGTAPLGTVPLIRVFDDWDEQPISVDR